ncbi:hypothetical protein P3W45_001393 [Vairimorpha bombi]|jgi:hypothetical protein
MTKKIKLRNIDSLISAICKTLPPSSKEDLKTINKLKLFIEKHTITETDNKSTELNDKLFGKVVDLSYIRRDLCKEILDEYKKWTQSVYNTLSICVPNTKKEEEIHKLIDTKELKEIRKINEMCGGLIERMNTLLVEKKNLRQTEKGIIKYFRSL